MYLEVEERKFILIPGLTHLSWLSLHPRVWRLEVGSGPWVLTESWVPSGGLPGAWRGIGKLLGTYSPPPVAPYTVPKEIPVKLTS